MEPGRRGDGDQVHQVHALAATCRRGHEQLRIAVAGRRQLGVVLGAIEHAAGCLDPVVVEGGLHLRHHRAFDTVMRVAPVLRVLRIAHPLVSHADAAGEADAAIDHQQLAMGAVVDAVQVVPGQRAVAMHLHPGVGHVLDQRGIHLQAAAPVDGDAHLDPGARARGQRLAELAADLARPVDIGLEGDGALRAADGGQHLREDLATVVQHLDLVAGQDRRTQQYRHLAFELRVGHVVAVARDVLELFLRRGEVEQQQPHHQRGDDRGRDDPCHVSNSGSLPSTASSGRHSGKAVGMGAVKGTARRLDTASGLKRLSVPAVARPAYAPKCLHASHKHPPILPGCPTPRF